MSDAHIEAENPPIRPSAPVERSISPISGPLGAGRAGKAIVVVALVAGCGVFLAATWRGAKPHAAMAPDQPARQVVPFEPLVTSPAPTLANPGAGAPELGPIGPPATQPGARVGPPANAAAPAAMSQADIRGAPLIAYSRDSAPAGVASSPNGPAVPAIEVAGSATTELDQLRHGSVVGEVRATRLPDRNFLIVAGGVIPCLLQTAMDTATPGYASCLIPRDVFSDNGAVVLLEKGTRVLGEYRSSMKQGQTRLFVLWTRAVTPAGVAIRLESPAADGLGRAGFDGNLDTHFWERFGGALLLSIVDDSSSGLASGATSNTARVPSDAAAVALQNSVNIPPSLRKAQGAEVSIFVAQDFDFSGVYSLKAR